MSKPSVPRLTPQILTAFIHQCHWTYDVWKTHKVLFDENPKKTELEVSVAGKGLERISIITQE
jgi:hypothetical protein